MKKTELLKQLQIEISDAQEHKCDDKECQLHLSGVIDGLRAVKGAIETDISLHSLLTEYADETFKKFYGQQSIMERVFGKKDPSLKEMMNSLKTDLDKLNISGTKVDETETLKYKQEEFKANNTDLRLKFLGYRYEGLVLTIDGVTLEAYPHTKKTLNINEEVWSYMTQYFNNVAIVGIAIVIFKEYEQGVKIVDQYINYKLTPTQYDVVLSELKQKYDL